jgi:membrane-associated protein
LNKQHLVRTQLFYERHGGKTIFLARFVPIIRTFAPFVAGIGHMRYRYFATYNVTGAIAWVVICMGAGALFGEIPIVKQNFELVVLGIIVVSLIPVVTEFLKARREAQSART